MIVNEVRLHNCIEFVIKIPRSKGLKSSNISYAFYVMCIYLSHMCFAHLSISIFIQCFKNTLSCISYWYLFSLSVNTISNERVTKQEKIQQIYYLTNWNTCSPNRTITKYQSELLITYVNSFTTYHYISIFLINFRLKYEKLKVLHLSIWSSVLYISIGSVRLIRSMSKINELSHLHNYICSQWWQGEGQRKGQRHSEKETLVLLFNLPYG